MATKSKRPRRDIPFDFITGPPSPGDSACVNASISACVTSNDHHRYSVAIYTQDPSTPNPNLVGSVQFQGSTGTICQTLPIGAGLGPRYIQWIDKNTNISSTVSIATMNCLNRRPDDPPFVVSLNLQLDTPAEAGTSVACDQVNRPTSLIHSRDPAFACCWFSRAIDFGDAGGNPAFWMLKKTADDTWFLCLRRVSHELAAYHLKTKKSHCFPLTFKRGRVGKEFKKWPRTITISPAE